MERKREGEVSRLPFYATVLVIAWLAYRMVQPYLVEVGWAAVLAICLDPVRLRLEPRLGRTRTAFLLTFAVLVLLVLPAVFVGTAVITEGSSVASNLRDQLQGEGGAASWLHRGWAWARQRATFLPPEDVIAAKVTASAGRVAEYAAGQAGGLVKGVASFLFALVVMLGILFFLLCNARSFGRGLRRVMPFGREENERMMALTSDLVSASVTSTVAVAAVQGLIGGVAFALLGVKAFVLLGMMTFVLAFVPLVGATLVWLPAAAWLALSGSVVKGIVLALIGILVLANVDNVLRPLLLSGKAQMNTLVLVISLMTGVGAFGFIGIVLGPLVAALLTVLVTGYFASLEPGAASAAVAPPAEAVAEKEAPSA
jgi:predicted PurR-regulated permease PerM